MQFGHLSSNRTGGNGVQVETKNQKSIHSHRAHVLHKTLNLVISRLNVAKKCTKNSNARTGHLFFSCINAIILDVLVALAIVTS